MEEVGNPVVTIPVAFLVVPIRTPMYLLSKDRASSWTK